MLCLTLAPVQFHTWLTTGIPDGQPKLLLSFLPYEDFPLLNFGMATASESLTLPHNEQKLGVTQERRQAYSSSCHLWCMAHRPAMIQSASCPIDLRGS